MVTEEEEEVEEEEGEVEEEEEEKKKKKKKKNYDIARHHIQERSMAMRSFVNTITQTVLHI